MLFRLSFCFHPSLARLPTASPDREAVLRTVQEFRHMIQLEATAFGAKCRTEAEMAEISQACPRHAKGNIAA